MTTSGSFTTLLFAHVMAVFPLPGDATPLPLLLPDPSHTKLLVQTRALDWLSQLEGPVAIVSVVGAYRSGKSFVLNELTGEPCSTGFVVGHRREAQTQGVWLSQRVKYVVEADSQNITQVFMDTEGFQSTGQSGVYDDRIFAFAALISSAVVYNLVETIKEADLERLALATQLAQEFWKRSHRATDTSVHRDETRQPAKWTPPSLLWLVQRDFLQGSTVDSFLKHALRSDDHPDSKHAERLNKIRGSLGVFRHMMGMGLVEPHHKRTQLCTLDRGKFDREYLQGLANVSRYISSYGVPKQPTPGRPLNGAALATLTSRLVQALNTPRIPTAGLVVDAFNAELAEQLSRDLGDALERFGQERFPVDNTILQAKFRELLQHGQAAFDLQSIGTCDPSKLISKAKRSFEVAQASNLRLSLEICEAAETKCMERLLTVEDSRSCREMLASKLCSYRDRCIGPAAWGFNKRARAAEDFCNQLSWWETILLTFATMFATIVMVGASLAVYLCGGAALAGCFFTVMSYVTSFFPLSYIGKAADNDFMFAHVRVKLSTQHNGYVSVKLWSVVQLGQAQVVPVTPCSPRGGAAGSH